MGAEFEAVLAPLREATLKRGLAEADETCEIAGTGPVPVATVEELLGNAFGAAIVTNGVDVFTVALLGPPGDRRWVAPEKAGQRSDPPAA